MVGLARYIFKFSIGSSNGNLPFSHLVIQLWRARESLLRMSMPPLRKEGRGCGGNFGLDEIKSLNRANEIVMQSSEVEFIIHIKMNE